MGFDGLGGVYACICMYVCTYGGRMPGCEWVGGTFQDMTSILVCSEADGRSFKEDRVIP